MKKVSQKACVEGFDSIERMGRIFALPLRGTSPYQQLTPKEKRQI